MNNVFLIYNNNDNKKPGRKKLHIAINVGRNVELEMVL